MDRDYTQSVSKCPLHRGPIEYNRLIAPFSLPSLKKCIIVLALALDVKPCGQCEPTQLLTQCWLKQCSVFDEGNTEHQAALSLQCLTYFREGEKTKSGKVYKRQQLQDLHLCGFEVCTVETNSASKYMVHDKKILIRFVELL